MILMPGDLTRATFVTITSILWCMSASAQNTTLIATTNSRQVVENQVFDVTFTLKNSQGSTLRPPPFTEFDVVNGPSVSMSTTMVNNKMSQSRAWTYQLLAKKTGKFTIGKARIKVGNKTLKSNALSIEIVKGKPGATTQSGNVMPTDDQVFLRAEIDSSRIYPGQQVKIKYKVYTTVNVRNYNTLKEDNYEEFYFRYVNDASAPAQYEMINGVQFRSQVLKSVALFPQQTGTFTIDPLVVNLGIGVQNNRRRGFFFSPRTIPKTVTSNDLKLNVLPLPRDSVGDFTGAVGEYRMQVKLDRQKVTTDDALVLSLVIQGDGDAKRWAPPSLDHLRSQFEVYEPKIVSDQTGENRGVLLGTKTIEYLLIPKKTGTQRFRIHFTYFNPDSTRYEVIHSPIVAVAVTQGKGIPRGNIGIDNRSVVEMAPLKSPRKLRRKSPTFLFGPLFFILAGLPFIALAFVWKRKQGELAFEGLDPVEKRRRRAKRNALKHLESAQKYIADTDKIYYNEISKAIFGYVSSKLKIPTSELTKANIREQLDQLAVEENRKSEIMTIILACEQVLYAGGAGQEGRDQIYQRTMEAISGLEDELLKH